MPRIDISKYRYQAISNVLGQMEMMYGQVLVSTNADNVQFFKQEFDLKLEKTVWKEYHKLAGIKARVCFTPGNIRVQCVMDDLIQFYHVDPETLAVTLENTMSNYMRCNYMYYGPKVRYCITYQNGSRKIQIYRRKVFHNFKVSVSE